MGLLLGIGSMSETRHRTSRRLLPLVHHNYYLAFVTSCYPLQLELAFMPSHGKSNKRNENWHQVVGILNWPSSNRRFYLPSTHFTGAEITRELQWEVQRWR
ncbi:hypothetical protein FOVSG1_012420 [Fusarium oxysporum f. sp. vasinfectum]